MTKVDIVHTLRQHFMNKYHSYEDIDNTLIISCIELVFLMGKQAMAEEVLDLKERNYGKLD